MGRRRRTTRETEEETESHSSSSSDFEFRISISPRKSSTPADDLFYKGQLLPLHLSPRISMVRTLLLSPPSLTPPRHSTASSSTFTDCDSSRPSSATDDDTHHHNPFLNHCNKKPTPAPTNNKYFSFSRFSSVFRKPSVSVSVSDPSISVKRSMGTTAKEVIRKCLKKVKKPLYGKFSHKQRDHKTATKTERSTAETELKKKEITIESAVVSSSCHSFSGNLRYPRQRSTYVSSCPSSVRSSPTHSGALPSGGRVVARRGACYSDASTMEEFQSAIQGAIAHCKNSLVQDKTMVNGEI